MPDPVTLRPAAAADVARLLRDAADARQSILIRGAGTKMDCGRLPRRIDAVLEMRSLDRVLEHEHGDMTATVEAGATLADLNRLLARRGQWLPLDPPHAGTATIGGILAANDSGPLRHRYGTPRDLLIGVQLATTDGALAKAGGKVVKNVAGYDLGKLVTGSFGSLAAIVTATFKLSPIPAASKTLCLDVDTAGAVAQIVRTVMTSQLEPISFEIRTQRPQADSQRAQNEVLIRFASIPAAIDTQIDRAATELRGFAAGVRIVEGDAEHTVWREHAERIWREDDGDAIVRASWLPAEVGAVLETAGGEMIGRAAVGAGLIRIAGDAEAQAREVERLRASSVLGNVVILRGSAELKARADVWGPAGDRQPLFEALKRAFDPHDVLNAGRGPL